MKTAPINLKALCLLLIASFLFSLPRACSAQEQILYSVPASISTRDNYNGATGCRFTVGPTNVVVSHLGYFNQTGTGLATNHYVGIFDSTFHLLGQVVVPSGSSALYANQFYWMQLDPPLLLNSNTTYYVAAQPYSGDGDNWGDSTTVGWNGAFVGMTTNTINAPQSAYGPAPGGNYPGWPPSSFSTFGSNTTYILEGLGYIGAGPARVGVQTTNVSIAAGTTLSVNGFGSGQPTINYQWWLSPNTPLNNQTNAVLNVPNATTGNSGTYYLTASNSLGGERSANVTVTVTAVPVGISQQPTNLTVFQNYPASFSMMATGTPPISLQWSRNGNPIPGATSTNYTLAVAALSNNGDTFACLASNYIASTAYTAQSSNATLTVRPNLALPQQFLHGYETSATNNSYVGQQGGLFTVGNSPVLVTHLGYWAAPWNTTVSGGVTNCYLATDHHVGIFYAANAPAGGSIPTNNLLGSVVVPAGNNPVINGYMWVALNPPLVLSSNTQYLLVAETTGDQWGDTYHIPDLNPYFATSCSAVYGGSGWGQPPYLGGEFGGQMYSAPNMAILALPTPGAYVTPATITVYASTNATFRATVEGQAPVTLQWYEEPGTLLSGQTNLTLSLSNLTTSQSGNYYVIATNYLTAANVKSADATLTVLPDVGPTITNDLQTQTVFEYQTAQFTVGASGTPPLTYLWTFNGNLIPGATNNTLAIHNVTAGNVGNYQVTVTNLYGQASSSTVGLSVTIPGWGSYPAAVMGSGLIAYYPLNDVSTGTATNQGSLGLAYNGTYEGGYSSVTGPTNILSYPPTATSALALDGFSADVLVPSLPATVSNCTIAAWVMDDGSQVDNNAIFYHRSGSVFGLAIGQGQSGTVGEWLKYTWNNNFYNNYTALTLPTNQWAFVAMVINPTNAAIYLQNGTTLQSTNFAGSYPPQTFNDGDSYIGYDTAGGATGRRWYGDIAQVMIFNHALSPVAINALYLGVPASATLTIAPAVGNNLTVTWPGGTLQEATNLAGPWTPTAGANNGVYTFTPTAAAKYYRVKLQ